MAFDMLEALTLIAREKSIDLDTVVEALEASLLVAAQKKYYLHTIECFGPERCMFESNFPVDKLSISYPVLWNAFKKIVADFSEDEKQAMFHDTARKVYSL